MEPHGIGINLKTPFSEQMIDKYGMEVEDVDDFLDAFVSRTLAKIPSDFHGPADQVPAWDFHGTPNE